MNRLLANVLLCCVTVFSGISAQDDDKGGFASFFSPRRGSFQPAAAPFFPTTMGFNGDDDMGFGGFGLGGLGMFGGRNNDDEHGMRVLPMYAGGSNRIAAPMQARLMMPPTVGPVMTPSMGLPMIPPLRPDVAPVIPMGSTRIVVGGDDDGGFGGDDDNLRLGMAALSGGFALPRGQPVSRRIVTSPYRGYYGFGNDGPEVDDDVGRFYGAYGAMGGAHIKPTMFSAAALSSTQMTNTFMPSVATVIRQQVRPVGARQLPPVSMPMGPMMPPSPGMIMRPMLPLRQPMQYFPGFMPPFPGMGTPWMGHPMMLQQMMWRRHMAMKRHMMMKQMVYARMMPRPQIMRVGPIIGGGSMPMMARPPMLMTGPMTMGRPMM